MGQGATKQVDKGMGLYLNENFTGAIAEWNDALKRTNKSGKLLDRFNILGYLCSVYFDTGKYRDVILCANQQVELCHSLRDKNLKQEGFFNLARGYEKLASYEKSINFCKNCLDLGMAENGQTNDIELFAYVCLGKAYYGISDFHSSLKNFEDALSKSDKDNNACVKFLVYESLGLLFAKLGDFDTSLTYLERCLDIVDANNEELAKYRRRVQVHISIPLLHSGRASDAMDMCECSMKDAMIKGDRPVQGKCLFAFAEIHRKRKDYERAYPRYESSYSIFAEMGDRMSLLDVLHGMAKSMAALKDFQQALELNQKACDLAMEIGNKFGYLESQSRMVDLHRMVGNPDSVKVCEHEVARVTQELELFCGICGEQMGLSSESLDPLPCGHIIHGRCVGHLARHTWGRKGRIRPCPSCRARSSGNPVL